MKGSIAVFGAILPLVSYSYAFPLVQEISSTRWTSSTGPARNDNNLASSAAAAAAAVAWATASVPLRARRTGSSDSSSSRGRSSTSHRLRQRVLLVPTRCRPTYRCAGGVGAVSFGSSGLAGVEGWASEARAGLDRDAVVPGAADVDDGVGEAAASTVKKGNDGDDDEALDAFVSAVAATTVAAVVDEGEATCRQLEGVVSRETVLAGRRILLRVATLDDYFAIADVRFDVFSPVHATLKHRFRERSCLLMKERRRKGAFCLVAVLEGSVGACGEEVEGTAVDVTEVSDEHVLGTLECSRHEFDGTPLAVDVEEGASKISRLYLTEVAVRSDCRRMGIGRVLLNLVDDVAKELNTAEVFLHVNEINNAALRLYESCGYDDAPDCASNRAFTNSLGLAGGFIGQRHRLLHKTFKSSGRSNSGDGGSRSIPHPPS